MAQRLDVEKLISTVGRPAKYPWEDWTDGTAWRVVEGDDYVKESTMKNSLRQYATQRGFYVVISQTEPGTIDFQFNKKGSK